MRLCDWSVQDGEWGLPLVRRTSLKMAPETLYYVIIATALEHQQLYNICLLEMSMSILSYAPLTAPWNVAPLLDYEMKTSRERVFLADLTSSYEEEKGLVLILVYWIRNSELVINVA